jgi:Prolyl oligopeptidase family
MRYAVQPNYRGSTGYGEDSIQSLPGQAGTNDVADCMTALQATIDQGDLLHASRHLEAHVRDVVTYTKENRCPQEQGTA